MDCLATSPVLSNKLIPFPTTNSKLGASFQKIYRSTTKQKSRLSFSRENCESRSNVAIKSSRGVSSLQTQQELRTWEDPDIRSDSDDEYGDEEDKSLGFKNDGEQKETETQDEYEERIKKGTFVFQVIFSLLESVCHDMILKTGPDISVLANLELVSDWKK